MEQCHRKMIKLPKNLTGSFIYVDCGARGDSIKKVVSAFADAHYIGFEPDAEECKRLMARAQAGYSYYPVAIGKQSGSANLLVTKNPGCSSLYTPNRAFFEPFQECGPFFDVVSTQQVQLVALDDYLSQNGIMDVDFLELDTQGAELDVLYGAQNFLKNSLVGVKVEVEFAEMYKNQPMFGDVDGWLRQHGFILFDLERYHLRRKSCPPQADSREQIVWGQALYFRDFRSLASDLLIKKQKLSKMAMVASYFGFHSYALEVINYLTQDTDLLTVEERKAIEDLAAKYVSRLENSRNRRIGKWLKLLDQSPFDKIFQNWGKTLTNFYEAYQLIVRKQKYFWKD